jgi:hypothetical protein
LPPLADPDVAAYVAAYTATLARLRSRVVGTVESSWLALPAYRDADIANWIELVAPLVSAGQAQTAAFTDAYLAGFANLVLEQPTGPAGLDPTLFTTEAMRGAPVDEVYRRPAITLYKALADGTPFADAVELGRQRAVDIASTDLQLAKTTAAQASLSHDKRVVGYRRVLEGGKSCGLCLVASTQRYHRAQLMPIHPGCDCGISPIYATKDPGQVIDPQRLESVHVEIADRFGQFDAGGRTIPGQAGQYRDELIVHTHGEIGPVLGVRRQVFTSPADL